MSIDIDYVTIFFSQTWTHPNSIDDSYVHLTNVAIQKTAPDYDPDKGCKWSLQQLRKYLTAKHGTKRIEKMFDEMNEIFVKRFDFAWYHHCVSNFSHNELKNGNAYSWCRIYSKFTNDRLKFFLLHFNIRQYDKWVVYEIFHLLKRLPSQFNLLLAYKVRSFRLSYE